MESRHITIVCLKRLMSALHTLRGLTVRVVMFWHFESRVERNF